MANPCDCEEFEDSIRRATKLADYINTLCPNTIYTILFISGSIECQSVFYHCEEIPTPPKRYKWGEVIDSSSFCELRNISLKRVHPDIVSILFVSSHDLFYKNLTVCPSYSYYQFRKTKFFKYFTISDIENDNQINMTGLVEIWTKAFNDVDNAYILERAFDSYLLEKTPITTGWWYLKRDPGTGNTSEYEFEEKSFVAEKVDHEENPIYYHWLHEKHNFDNYSTGIILNNIFEYPTIRNNFCQFILMDKKDNLENILKQVYNHSIMCGSNFKIIFVYDRLSENAIRLVKELVKNKIPVSILIPVTFKHSFNNAKCEFLDNIGSKEVKFGYLMPIEICHLQEFFNNYSKDKFAKLLNDPDSHMYVFYYTELEEKVKLGATRIFRLRKILLEKCIRLVTKIRETDASVGFMLTGYPKVSKLYDSLLFIQNYVKYMYLLNRWALKEKNTVIFIGNAVDGTVNFLNETKFDAVGWYSFNKNIGKFETKRQQALRLSVSAYSNSSLNTQLSNQLELSKNQAMLILCISVVLVLCVALVVTLVAQQYYRKRLNSEEIKRFFSGSLCKSKLQGLDEQAEPYDKARYEIPVDKFKINEDKILGSGEFGKKIRGTVLIDGVEVDVAVKTSNPYNLNKLTLKGLLSEIKVLCYLETHDNILQIIGANTASIKDGKVFIFLELCSLGSLEKFLRQTCPLQNTTENLTSCTLSVSENNYLNTNKKASVTLDQSLSQELYQWSTEICNGMAYLAEKQVVHADLATRNVLISLRREAKICDFGLSRRLYNYGQYVKSQQEPLPWKWMAPEALRLNTFDEKTDVWAYGVTLWEIYSLGCIPFSGISWDANFAAMLEGGLRMPKPQYEEKQM